MNILITGASSYVGAKFYVDMQAKHVVTGTYNSNRLFPGLEHLDITERDEVMEFIEHKKPDYIIHVAANASGRWCEKNPEQAIAINDAGTRNIVDAANKVHSKMIYISSFEHANAKTLYGRTKEAGEIYVKKTDAGYVILRPCLIIGLSPNTTNDRPFNRLLKNITEHTPAIYDASWKFYPTWLQHIEDVIEAVIKKDIINEIIPISVSDVKTRFDLAKDILTEFNIEVRPEYPDKVAPLISEDLERLVELDLPQYTYDEMIQGIKGEIHGFLKK